jgi:hypothetical protein
MSLAAVLAVCLLLNAASPPIRVCQRFDRNIDATGAISALASRRVVPTRTSGSQDAPHRKTNDERCTTDENGY